MADVIAPRADEIVAGMGRGSVIDRNRGVRALALLAATSPERNAVLVPLLLDRLARCRAKEVPQHAESTIVADTTGNRAAFVALVARRLPELTHAQATRVRKMLRRLA